ncbi:MAG TPA: hypothetical protein VJ623_14485 [Holophagaceae bacterium]|nr:hypothetical protein [Holophagaceae bacterium]
MPTLKSKLQYIILVLIGIGIGSSTTGWMCWRSMMHSQVDALEVSVQRNMALLAELGNGNNASGKRNLDQFLGSDLELINAIARGSSGPSAEAREFQRRVKEWRNRNPSLALSQKLSAEVQNAMQAAK